MSASLIVLIPVVLLGVVTALCFVGCGLNTHGNIPPGPYETAIPKTANLVAWWPLGDLQATTLASDEAPKQPPMMAFNGTYVGGVTRQQTGIVPSDLVDTLTKCALFTNGLVQVDFHQELNPGSFTLEAWVKPQWSAGDPQIRAVLVSANSTAGAGFALLATTDNFWQIQVGIGGGNFTPVTATENIPLNSPVAQYLAVTFDSVTQALTLFVGTVEGGFNSFSSTLMNAYVPEDSSSSTSLFIGMGRPDMPGGMFPFNGFIQDVAIYNVALEAGIVQGHFMLGSAPPG